MRSQRGVTLTSLIVYVIAMVLVVALITTLTKYFFGNVDSLTSKTQASKEYTSFNSYFINEINTKGNSVITELMNVAGDSKIVFSSGNQFTFVKEDGGKINSIFFNKIKICSDVSSCSFEYNEQLSKIKVTMVIAGKSFSNEYTLVKDI